MQLLHPCIELKQYMVTCTHTREGKVGLDSLSGSVTEQAVSRQGKSQPPKKSLLSKTHPGGKVQYELRNFAAPKKKDLC